MKFKFTILFFLFPLTCIFNSLFSQDYTLKLSSKKRSDFFILNTIEYQKKHKDSLSIYNELDKISSYLNKIGYFTHIIDSISKSDYNFTAFFQLNTKIENAILTLNNLPTTPIKEFNFKDNKLTIPIEKLQETLHQFSIDLEKKGKSFSKVTLREVKIENKNLYGTLIIKESQKRTINKVFVKGYDDFPKSFIKNFFNIKQNTTFNKNKLKKIEELSKNLNFAEKIKPPEVLFSKDSTYIYIYLKKKNASSFDGLVNFASKENGKLLFNGHIDLKLSNFLNTGENLNLFWNRIGEERQEFELSLEIPYIFNSSISPETSFSIYKQDSTFINTKFNTAINYSINDKSKIGLTFSLEDSEKLINNPNNNVATFSNFFLGTKYQFSIPKNDFFRNNKFYFEINPLFGRRIGSNENSNQFKILLQASYIFDINNRNSVFIRNNSGYLNSTTFIENELFRIGGANSIRGFNEQSIFTKDYTYFNIEYRYLTTEKSYLYTITDVGKINTNSKSENLLSFGLGYLFTSKNSQINLSIAKNTSNTLKNVQLAINWVNYF
ncbi:hypothetical protein JL193_12620 [Polaribacter batillariae]|uniref:Haemolysin activator HlyB C-terminal domain-containing protein n=1 Tax=Polaribacter batillariae TaxID=2808900 RepID=A0ABX7SRV4_9FLAO|nr:ShlB/FhaC/HecB family hemolysin secretion/activation protein [Polaribacter batillariae]QTD36962.1 hypothetical protein JL193_12620 [Polaribacter batillariae]